MSRRVAIIADKDPALLTHKVNPGRMAFSERTPILGFHLRAHSRSLPAPEALETRTGDA
jgi:hypothetical protein